MVAALAAALLASACQPRAPSAVEADAASTQVVASAGDAEGSGASKQAGSGLDEAAARALREGRLYAPAGDSAIEYWLQARDRDPGNAAVASAIVELQPYLLIGCEQAIARHDFEEARRLHGLIAASDAGAPALQRLAMAIEAAEAESGRAEAVRLAAEEAQRQRAEAEVRAAEMASAAQGRVAAAQVAAAAAQPPAAPAPSSPTSASVADARPQSPAVQPPPQSQAEAVGTAPAPAQFARTPTAAAARETAAPAATPRLLRQPAPRFPPLALSRKMEGSVQVAFTIRPDGRVEDTRVVSSTPPGVFERSALAAVSGYRFEPMAQATASMVTVRFTLSQ